MLLSDITLTSVEVSVKTELMLDPRFVASLVVQHLIHIRNLKRRKSQWGIILRKIPLFHCMFV